MKISTLLLGCFFGFFFQKMVAQTDTIPPTVFCINGLSVSGFNLSGTTMLPSVTLWATDFLQYAEDNLTDPSEIELALRDPDINPGTGFPLESNGQPQVSLQWDCSQIGTNSVELWARDLAGNTDFCLTYLILSNNTGFCNFDPAPPTICIVGPSGQMGVADVSFVVSSVPPSPGMPSSIDPPMNNGNGCYSFSGFGWPFGMISLELMPKKDINPLNGVSTFDLVRISKHVLNVQPFTSPLKFVAADINHNNNVTTFDIVELRKLILGIYTDFPTNDSWRFVRKDPNFGSPFWYSNLAENCMFSVSMQSCEFDAVKIGDLTGDAIAINSPIELPAADREATLFSLENRALAAGQAVEIPIFLEKENSLLAWQMALRFDPDFIEIKETLPELMDGSGAMPMVARTAPGRVAMNWFSTEPRPFLAGHDALISLKINVLRDCKLADVLFLENENLAPEAYFPDETSQPISLLFSEKNAPAHAQNLTAWPNPFSEKTTLAWSQNEPGEARIEVFDATGRAVFSTKILGEKGANRFEINGFSEGLFFVKIQSGGEVLTASILSK